MTVGEFIEILKGSPVDMIVLDEYYSSWATPTLEVMDMSFDGERWENADWVRLDEGYGPPQKCLVIR